MNKAILIAALILILASCIRQNDKKESSGMPSPESLVVEEPAAVLFQSGMLESRFSEARKNSAERILAPLNIPVIISRSPAIEFVKSNGDRVSLDVQSLRSSYDLILFDAVNDPVPCRIRDLDKAAGSLFTHAVLPVVLKEKKMHSQILETTGDTVIINKKANAPRTLGIQKRIMLTVPDISSVPKSILNTPGIQLVEQRTDTRSQLTVTFENDLITYANTDRYFTNGITFSLKAAWIGRIRLSSLMIPYRHPSSASYSLSLVQNMFTPTDTRVAPLLHNDRPYASYLYLGYSKVTSDPVRMLKLTTEIDIGYTGPRSPGAYLQTLVHGTFPTNDQPLGWETQIKTGPIVNYTIHLEKALINRDQLMLSTSAYVKTGTLYNQIGTGFRLQAGRQEPSFSSGTATRTSHWQYYFFLNARGALIGYDATLEGGIFNRNEVFTLSTNEISRWVASAETGFRITYKGTGLELAQHYLSPEYKGGLAHKWGRISLLFDL